MCAHGYTHRSRYKESTRFDYLYREVRYGGATREPAQ